MTQVDILFRYAVEPNQAVLAALSSARDVYGIRALAFDRAEKTLRIEYDATRLTPAAVTQIVRRAGLDIVEEISLIPPQPEPEPAAAQ